MNSDSLLDKDGLPGSEVAKDAYRFSLNYFNGDYAAIGNAVSSVVFPGHSAYMEDVSAGDYKPLYNGNISSMVVGIPQLGEMKLYNYGYDQLNRIVSMDTWRGYNSAEGNWNDMQKTQDYKERISYDANGNIKTYQRNGVGSTQAMDDLTYGYNKDGNDNIINNRLRHVKDAVSDGNYTEDIDNQDDDNYEYDAIGNLTKDTKEGISTISWTVYGKIKKITKTDGTAINYTYDVAGNRISKAVTKDDVTTTTWYSRDAQGNPMAIYTGTATSLVLGEQPLYGSSRLGVWNRSVDMDAPFTENNNTFVRGNKIFELPNHLGNVLVTISDKKLGYEPMDRQFDKYTAEIMSANDYYPGGMEMPGRTWDNGSSYQYGFNGKRKDNEIYGAGNTYDFGARIYDSRLVKWLSVDPLQKKLPALTPYNYCYNNPIIFFDPDGKLGIRVQAKYNEKSGTYTILKITIDDDLRAVPPIPGVGNIGMDYHDYIDVTVFDEKGNIDYGRSMLQSTFRTNNIALGKWWAKAKVNDGVFEDYGGIMWTSQEQTAGSEETRNGQPSFMANIYGLLAMVDGGNELAGLQFEKKDLLEVLDKFAKLIQEASNSKPADNVDINNPKQASLMNQLEAILAKYPTQSTTPENTPKTESGRTPKAEPVKTPKYKTNTILYTEIGNVRVNNDGTQTCCQDDKKATDTVPSMKKNKTN